MLWLTGAAGDGLGLGLGLGEAVAPESRIPAQKGKQKQNKIVSSASNVWPWLRHTVSHDWRFCRPTVGQGQAWCKLRPWAHTVPGRARA
jgi:hypothetical protein